jgi:predicted metallopeptidase
MKEQLTGTCTLSQTFMPTYLNEPIKINAHDLFPCTSIFATTVDGEITDVINIKDSFNRLPKEEKLKIVSVLLEFCAMETCNLINQNK